jgi:hypothetical protein
MNTSSTSATLAACALTAALLLPRASAAADAPSAAAPERGVWQKHEYSFAYFGFTSTYSCDGLADKLKILLLAAGARSDAKSSAGACASGFGRPDKFARADLTFYTLAPTSGDSAADAKPVSAVWRPVSFASRSPRELQTGDCELVEQFRSNVLPLFTARNIVNQTTCIPNQLSGSNISLRFDSLSAAPGARRTAAATSGGA